MLVIVLMLSCLNNLLAQDKQCFPLRASEHRTDTTNVIIPINLIKQANVKMLERIYLIKINNEKDSIITLKDNYIKEQSIIIKDFQNKIYNINNYNKVIEQSLEKEKRKNKIIMGVGCSAIIGLIVGIFIN